MASAYEGGKNLLRTLGAAAGSYAVKKAAVSSVNAGVKVLSAAAGLRGSKGKRKRNGKKRAGKKLTKKIKKVIRTEEMKDRPTGMYVRQHGYSFPAPGFAMPYWQNDFNAQILGITTTKCANAAAVLFNSKADSPDFLGTGSNYAATVKFEIQSVSAEYTVHNNTLYPITLYCYVYEPKSDTNITLDQCNLNLVEDVTTRAFGSGAANPTNFLFENSYYKKSSTHYIKVTKMSLRPSQTITYTVRGKNYTYCEKEHLLNGTTSVHWLGLTKLVAFRAHGDYQSMTTAGGLSLPVGADSDGQKICIVEKFRIKVMSPNPSTEAESDQVVYSNWLADAASTFESTTNQMLGT